MQYICKTRSHLVKNQATSMNVSLKNKTPCTRHPAGRDIIIISEKHIFIKCALERILTFKNVKSKEYCRDMLTEYIINNSHSSL